jgi:hypothetical protein
LVHLRSTRPHFERAPSVGKLDRYSTTRNRQDILQDRCRRITDASFIGDLHCDQEVSPALAEAALGDPMVAGGLRNRHPWRWLLINAMDALGEN